MARDIRDYLMMFTHREERMSTRMQMDIIHELSSRIRHGDIVIHHPMEIEELINVIAALVQRGQLSARYLDRLFHEILVSVEQSANLPPDLRDEIRHTLLRGMDRFAHVDLFEEEEAKKGKNENKRQEEQEKILQSIGNIPLAESDRVLFFVGAGASKPSPSNIPTVNELLPELWKKSSRMETKPLEKLQTWCRENNIENIEEMLTAVTISNFIIKSPKVHGLLNSVLYPEWKSFKEISIRDIDAVLLMDNMLNTFFSLLVGTMLQAKPNAIHKSIAEYEK